MSKMSMESSNSQTSLKFIVPELIKDLIVNMDP